MKGLRLMRQVAVPDAQGRRHCAACGDFIDPIDWCPYCQERQTPCTAHPRLRKRADAAFCGTGCKSFHRSSFISGCL